MFSQAIKSQSEELQKDDDYSSWVSTIPEDKWTTFQSKKGVTSQKHGKHTVFEIEMLEGRPPVEVQQKDPLIGLFKIAVFVWLTWLLEWVWMVHL